MQNPNIDAMNDIIRQLMETNNIGQQELAKVIDMTQPNFSRAISKKHKQCFTLVQVYKIAQYFNISIDYLLGNDKSSNSEKEICILFTSLLENRKLVKIDTSREEEIYTPYTRWDGVPDTEIEKRNVSYPAFIFPKHYDIGPIDRYTKDQLDDFRSDIYYGGNSDSSNIRINEFFEKYFQIYDMYLSAQITEDFFHEITKKFLDDLK